MKRTLGRPKKLDEDRKNVNNGDNKDPKHSPRLEITYICTHKYMYIYTYNHTCTHGYEDTFSGLVTEPTR